MLKAKALWVNGLIFAVAMWLLSRLFIAAVMLLITPLLPAPSGGLSPQLAGKSSTGGIVSIQPDCHFRL